MDTVAGRMTTEQHCKVMKKETGIETQGTFLDSWISTYIATQTVRKLKSECIYSVHLVFFFNTFKVVRVRIREPLMVKENSRNIITE